MGARPFGAYTPPPPGCVGWAAAGTFTARGSTQGRRCVGGGCYLTAPVARAPDQLGCAYLLWGCRSLGGVAEIGQVFPSAQWRVWVSVVTPRFSYQVVVLLGLELLDRQVNGPGGIFWPRAMSSHTYDLWDRMGYAYFRYIIDRRMLH